MLGNSNIFIDMCLCVSLCVLCGVSVFVPCVWCVCLSVCVRESMSVYVNVCACVRERVYACVC